MYKHSVYKALILITQIGISIMVPIFLLLIIGNVLKSKFNIDLVFSVCVVTTSFMSFILKKPIATVLLLLLCFKISELPIMLVAAFLGSLIGGIKCEKVEKY